MEDSRWQSAGVPLSQLFARASLGDVWPCAQAGTAARARREAASAAPGGRCRISGPPFEWGRLPRAGPRGGGASKNISLSVERYVLRRARRGPALALRWG